MPRPLTSLTLFAALLGCLSAQGSNLLVNGDFELGNTGFVSDYTYLSAQSFLDNGHYAVGTNPSLYHWAAASFGDHSSGSGLMMLVNGSGPEAGAVWRYDVSVSPNTDYDFSAYAASWTGPPANGDLVLGTLGFSINGQSVGRLVAPRATWTPFSTTWNSGSSTTATLRIAEAGAADAGGYDFALDDISLTQAAVPEPSTCAMALAGLACGGYSMFRRRRAR
jgi:hypothetical protein